jgi:hypothetical protein
MEFDVGELRDIEALETDASRHAETMNRFSGPRLETDHGSEPTYGLRSSIFDDGLVPRLLNRDRTPFTSIITPIIALPEADDPPAPEQIMSRREACEAMERLGDIDPGFVMELPPLPEGAPEPILEVIEIPGPSIDPCFDPCSEECLDIVEPRYVVSEGKPVESEGATDEVVEESGAGQGDRLIEGGSMCAGGICECPKNDDDDYGTEFITLPINFDDPPPEMIYPVIDFDDPPPCMIYL